MAKKDPRTKGFSWVCPALTVRDAAASLAFYERAFGFQRVNAMSGPDGTIQHAEMRYQDVTIMFSPEGAFGNTCKAPATSRAECPLTLYVYCPDVDAMAQRARQGGAQVLSEPADMFWGDRMSRLKDPDGYVWSFATNVAEFDPAKVPQG